jgi:hypothetical protein
MCFYLRPVQVGVEQTKRWWRRVEGHDRVHRLLVSLLSAESVAVVDDESRKTNAVH